MDPGIAAALARINQQFYERHAAAFNATRGRGWPGWERVAELAAGHRAEGDGRPSVLDLGCGNGRLAELLERCWRRPFDYLGIDASAALVAIARRRAAGPGRRRHLVRDLLDRGLPAAPPGAPFGLIAAFGLLHHLPGFDNRAALIAAAARLLAPGGLLALSFWQFGDRRRFRRRLVSWSSYNRGAAEPIDIARLEPGDLLLRWGPPPAEGEAPVVRYCHWAAPAEAERLVDTLPLDPVAGFQSDGEGGDLNLYRILAAPVRGG